VRLDVTGDRFVCDFTGTDGVQPNNLNANRAIVVAAILYVLRCLIDEPIPLNQGVLQPVELILPECLLNPSAAEPRSQSPAVAAGNVETSQRIVDVLLGALGVAAASQGTMNNLLFGNTRFGYYETICGGAGATAHAPGADAVHTHMTNTRLTDAEVLESRYPVRLRRFAIRRGSGGSGRHRGGDGVVRELEFFEPLSVSLVTQRRGPYLPYGMKGGQPGSAGCNWLIRASAPDSLPERLDAQVSLDVGPGDVLIVETPGGGGFFPPPTRSLDGD
jgi:5-oxoprolinase (ATP-hydrolysing)